MAQRLITLDEYWAKIQQEKIEQINLGNQLPKLNAAFIDEEAGQVRTCLQGILGCSVNTSLSIVTNKNMKMIINNLFQDIKNVYYVNAENSSKYKKNLEKLWKKLDDKIYGVDYVCATGRAREYSIGSINHYDNNKKLNHIIHTLELFIYKFNHPLIIDLEVAGDLKHIENNEYFCDVLNKDGYNIVMQLVSPIDFGLPFKQNRIMITAIHKDLDIKYDEIIANNEIDRDKLDYRDFLVNDTLIPNRFYATDGLMAYNEKLKRANNERRAIEGKPPCNSYRPTKISPDKKIYPGQFAKLSHNDGNPIYVNTNNRWRLVMPYEFAKLMGWSDEYFSLMSRMCNDKMLYRVFLGGMCYPWLIKHLRTLFKNIVKFNGLENTNFNTFLQNANATIIKKYMVGDVKCKQLFTPIDENIFNKSYKLGGNVAFSKYFTSNKVLGQCSSTKKCQPSSSFKKLF